VKTIIQRAFARAGLLGNPSDGYHGKTISIIVRNFAAQVTLTESDRLCLVPGPCEDDSFDSIDQLVRQIREQGHYGGVRLLKAAVKRFSEYCRVIDYPLTGRNFAMSYATNIPRQVGLAGSSAIVTAAMRGLMDWYAIDIHPHLLASLTLSAELELGIPAGLQDRVIQAYEGLVYMDFDESTMRQQHGLEFGVYEQLDPRDLPKLYIAYATHAGEPTEVLHSNLRQRFQQGEQEVVDAMKKFASFAEQGVGAIHRRDAKLLGSLIDQNFDLRNQICHLHREHVQMVHTARRVGASAKYCGSGGAIVGTFEDDDMFTRLKAAMSEINCHVIVPQVI
jgi:glucuronokinase